MQIIYERFKNKEITYPDGTIGFICGFTPTNLLVATLDRPGFEFRNFRKEKHFIEEQYKDRAFKYCYVTERMCEEQHLQK